MNLNLEELAKFPETSVVIIPGGPQSPEVFRRLLGKIRKAGFKGLVLCVPAGATVGIVDEEQMNAHGWFRKATGDKINE